MAHRDVPSRMRCDTNVPLGTFRVGVHKNIDRTELFERHKIGDKVPAFLTPAVRAKSADAIRKAAREFAIDNLPQHRPLTDQRVGLEGAPEYSVMRMIAAQVTGDWSRAGYEREVGQELARREGRSAVGIFMPQAALASRAVLVSSGISDMFGVEHLGGAFIESLKPHAAVMTLGATLLAGRDKDVSIPKVVNGVSAQWVGENAAPSDRAPTTDSVTLTYHQLSTTAAWSRKTIVQSDPAFDDIMRSDMRREIAVAVDRAAIAGAFRLELRRSSMRTVCILPFIREITVDLVRQTT